MMVAAFRPELTTATLTQVARRQAFLILVLLLLIVMEAKDLIVLVIFLTDR